MSTETPAVLPASSIRELAGMIRRGDVTPTQLARMSMDALDSRGRALNAVVTITEERALREAKRAEDELASGRDRGLLHGIPWGAKDLLATVGAPTTWGAAPFQSRVLDYDAAVVERLERAGAVLVAKLAMVELAGGMGYEELDAQFTGPGLNPWNPEAWAGGSSSGSGAAIGAGLVPFAIGSETFGSIIGPASYCGVTGLRPTYGRVSRFGAMALSWTMDKLGPLCRTADDAGLVLNAIAGPDPRDRTAAARPFAYPLADRRTSGFRFGLVRSWREGTQPEVAANFEASLEVLRELGAIEEIDLPDMPAGQAARMIIACEGASAFEDLIEDGRVLELTAPTDRVKPFAYAAIPAGYYLRAMRVRRHVSVAMDRLTARYDAILSPATPEVAPAITERLDRARRPTTSAPIGAFANLAGNPGISVPNGFGERGLPTSLLFTGRVWTESTLLAIASAYQSRPDWHHRVPRA